MRVMLPYAMCWVRLQIGQHGVFALGRFVTRMQRHHAAEGSPLCVCMHVASGWREQVWGIPIQRTHDARACTRVLERRTMLADTQKKLKLLCCVGRTDVVRTDATVHTHKQNIGRDA
jgi:hypothetical protein